MMLGMAGIGGAIATTGAAFNAATSTARATDLFVRRTQHAGDTFTVVREKLQRLGDGLQMTHAEAANLAVSFGKAANEVNQERAMEGARAAGGLARGFGMDPTQTAGGIGKLSLYGVGRDSGSQRQLMLMLGKTISQGMFGGKGEMVIEKLGQHVESFAQSTMKAPTDIKEFLTTMAAMGQMRGTHPGMAMHGMEVMGQMTNVLQGKGSEASQFFAMRAMQESGMFAGKSPWEIMYQSGEMTGTTKMPDGRMGFQVLMDSAKKHLGGADKYQEPIVGGALMGITPQQYTALEELSKNLSKPGAQEAFEKALGGANIDMSKLKEDAIKDLGDIAGADDKTLRGIAQERGLAGAEGMATEQLRDALLKDAAANGKTENEATKLTQATIDLRNKMEELGQELIDPVTKLANILGQVADEAKLLVNAIKEVARPIVWMAEKMGMTNNPLSTGAPTASDDVYKATGGQFKKTGGGLVGWVEKLMGRKEPSSEQQVADAEEGLRKLNARPADYGPKSAQDALRAKFEKTISDAKKGQGATGGAPSATQQAADAYAASGGTAGPLGDNSDLMKAVALPETGEKSGGMTDPRRFIRTRVTPDKNAGQTSTAYGPVQMTRKHVMDFYARNKNNLSPEMKEYVQRYIAQGEKMRDNPNDPVYGYGGKGELGATEQDRQMYSQLAEMSMADIAKNESKDLGSFIKRWRGANDAPYQAKINKKLGGKGEEAYQAVRNQKISEMPGGAKYQESKAADVPRDKYGNRTFPILDDATNDIYNSYKPIDGPDMPEKVKAANTQGNSGSMDIYVHEVDKNGKERKQTQHRQGLGRTSPPGAVHVQGSWMDAI